MRPRVRAMAAALVCLGALALALEPRGGWLGLEGAALAQQLGEGMSREGTVGPMTDEERKLFSGLICTCGCPRESLATCTCDIAAHRREALREGLSKGLRPEVLQANYVETYGPEALALPPNRGAHRLVWLLPLGALTLGGVLVARWLRRRERGLSAAGTDTSAGAEANVSATAQGSAAKPDIYDDRLEDELRELDDDR